MLIVALQVATLLAAWALFHPAATGLLGLALVYVLAVWTMVGWITSGSFLAWSLAPLPDVLSASLQASANAMWLMPGVLAMTTRSPVVVAMGLAIIVNATRLLALSRPPQWKKLPVRGRVRIDAREPAAELFCYQPGQKGDFSSGSLPGIAGALVLQLGIYALAARYPFPAALSFATVTLLWVSTSVSRGALTARRAARVPYSVPIVLLTLFLTVTFTALLLQHAIVQEEPQVQAKTVDITEKPSMTMRMLKRLAHVPPPPESGHPPRTTVAQVVDPGPASGKKGLKGIPGVVLRPPVVRPRIMPVVLAGSRLRVSSAQPLAIPFTGEYQLYRRSSGKLPKGAPVERGTPLDSLYGTTNGGPMETVAVQLFDPPIDLTNCGTVFVEVTSAEKLPVLAMMQLVTQASVEDGGTDVLGMKRSTEQVLEFQVPVTVQPLMVRSIRISFQRPESSKNVRIAVKAFTLRARGY
jgi:hypothetical protein